MAKKKSKSKGTKYQFGVGRRTIHIVAKNKKEAEIKAAKWRDKYAKNSVLAYDYIVD